MLSSHVPTLLALAAPLALLALGCPNTEESGGGDGDPYGRTINGDMGGDTSELASLFGAVTGDDGSSGGDDDWGDDDGWSDDDASDDDSDDDASDDDSVPSSNACEDYYYAMLACYKEAGYDLSEKYDVDALCAEVDPSLDGPLECATEIIESGDCSDIYAASMTVSATAKCFYYGPE